MWDLVCALQEWNFIFIPGLWSSCDQAPLACKVILLMQLLAGEFDVGLRTFHPMGELWLFSSLWSAYLEGVELWDLMISWMLPSYCLIFFVRFQSFLIEICAVVSCDFGILLGGGELKFFFSALFVSNNNIFKIPYESNKTGSQILCFLARSLAVQINFQITLYLHNIHWCIDLNTIYACLL